MDNCNQQFFSLTYLDRFKILHKEEDLDEPSGLVFSSKSRTLWTVSDDTRKIFNLSLSGELLNESSFKIEDKELEGITLDPSSECLFVVKEPTNEIIQFDLATQQEVARAHLANMAGYDEVEHFFTGEGTNKGLEGVAWNSATGTLFVIKESNPGLLLEVTADLQHIQGHQVLNDKNGFCDPGLHPEELDFSGICYDEERRCFWIISHAAKRLFLYDWKENQVLQSAPLGYGRKGKYKEIKQAEGIAIDPERNCLYVVSDQDTRLYIFDIRT